MNRLSSIMLKCHFFLLLTAVFFAACNKAGQIIVPDNDAPYYDEIPTLKVENYINKVFIDLIGREPTDVEMEKELAFLREGDLALEYRDSLINKLQKDTTYVPGDSSYKKAYYHWLYELAKAHTIEGASIDEINEFLGNLYTAKYKKELEGDTLSDQYFSILASIERLEKLISAEWEYFADSIELNEMMRRMIDNAVYNQINMNSFNFINATFDNLLFRYPSQEEFNEAYTMVEDQEDAVIFGRGASTKGGYMKILVESKAFYEGMVIWAYQTLLARIPSTEETYILLDEFYYDHDFQKVQRMILRTDEYANF